MEGPSQLSASTEEVHGQSPHTEGPSPSPSQLNTDCMSASADEVHKQPKHMEGPSPSPSQLNTDCQPQPRKCTDSQNT